MSTATEKMIVRVEADTSTLRTALEKGGVYVDQFSQKINTRFGKIESVFTGLGRTLVSAGVIVGMQQLASHTLDAVSALADLNDKAEQLGISAVKMQELGVLALQNGSDIEVMNDSLEQFTRRLGEAQNGQGALHDVLEQFGIAVRDAEGKNRSSIDVLNDLSDVLSIVTDQTQKATIISDAFGKSGASLASVLSLGSDELSRLGKEAQTAGLIIDQDIIDKASKFDDEWKKATYLGGVYFKTFAIDAVNALDEVAQAMADVYIQAGKPPSDSFSKISFSRIPLPKKTDFENVASGGSVDGLGSFSASMRNRMNNLGQLDNPFAETLKKSQAGDKKSADDKIKAYKDVVENLKFEAAQLGRTSQEQEIYNNLKQAGVSASSKEGQQISALTKAYRTQSDELERNKKVSDEWGQSITQNLNNAILGADSLSGSLKNIGLSIANSVLSKYITGPAGNFFGDAFASMFKFENGGIMTSGGSMPLRAYSSGGVANTPQLALFGEGKKPEAYVPLPDGRTIPVTMSGASSASSVQVTQHLNFALGVEQTARAEVMKMMPQIRQAAVSAINDASKRGTVRIS